MRKIKLRGNIKLTVLIGYVILFVLLLVGLVQIYKELVGYSVYDEMHAERKELSLVSNALVELYSAESVRKAIFFEDINASELKENYINVDKGVRLYVDSLYHVTTDEYLLHTLDTVNYLLDKKAENLLSMIALVDTIQKLPKSKFIQTTVLSQKDILSLEDLVGEKMLNRQDTSYYIKEKKTFGDRLRAVFSSKQDSVKVVATSDVVKTDSVTYQMPERQLLTDTLVHFINDINKLSDQKKAAYLSKLSRRQNAMIYYDESLTGQINTILRRIEEEEKEILANLEQEKEVVLKRSARIVAGIAIASIFVLFIFLSITFLLVNRNQQYRKDLEENNQHIRSLLKSRDRLLLMISHDVKAPLSSIIGHIELMIREKMSVQDKAHLESMRSSSEQILELSNKLIDHHQLEKNEQSMKVVSFSPAQLMNDVYNTFMPMAKRKNIKLEASQDINAATYYDSDPFMIKQILNNLISNAIKFTSEGGVYINALVDAKTNMFQIKVKDTGLGIKEEDKEKVFEAFERVGTTEDKLNIEGAGLGLQITKKLVELLQGTLEMDSEYGVGTEFRVSIPLVKSEVKSNTLKATKQTLRKGKKTSPKVLMVDDETTILSVYSKILEQNGAEVTICTNPSRVIELLGKTNYDIIFTDIQMPQINGFELVKRIRALGGVYAEIPVIALSARSDMSEKEFKKVGFTTFLSKPVPFEMLENMVFQFPADIDTLEKKEESTAQKVSEGFYSLIEFVKDDKETSLDILNTFSEDTQHKLDDLRRSVKAGDKESVQSVAHKMLPLATMMGMGEAARLMERVESGAYTDKELKRMISLIEEINNEAKIFIENFKKE